MEHPLIRVQFGGRAIGPIEGGNGFGSPVIGRDPRGLMPIGSLVIGSREGGAGSGLTAIGNTDKRVKI